MRAGTYSSIHDRFSTMASSVRLCLGAVIATAAGRGKAFATVFRKSGRVRECVPHREPAAERRSCGAGRGEPRG